MTVPQLSFRQKVLLLAITLVVVIQVGTLIAVLGAIRNDVDRQADHSVRLAGVVFDEFMRSRMAQLTTTVNVIASDFPFRNAVATGDQPTIESVLRNHAARAGTDTAILFDLDGNVMVSTGARPDFRSGAGLPQFASESGTEAAVNAVTFIGGQPYQTVTVPMLAPVTIAWVMLGFPIDAQFAADIATLTDLEASIVRFGVSKVDVFASTLGSTWRDSALASMYLGYDAPDSGSVRGNDFITSLRPILEETNGLYLALQLPLQQVIASYQNIRNVLYLLTGVALLLAVIGASGISRMVTRPVHHLVEAARRMREGVYTQPISIASNDEFGDLAAGFNSMQEAIAHRERHIFHIAHHDSLSGLPTRDIVVGQLRDKLAEVDRLAIVNLVLNRFDGIASSLGHRTADQVIKLIAGKMRNMLKEDQIIGHLKPQEFVFLLPEYEAEQAVEFVARLKDTLRAGVTVNGANISLQATAGLSIFPDHSADATELLRCAAIARNDTSHHVSVVGTYRPGQEERSLKLIRIVGDFPEALRNDELELSFQPKIDCNSLELAGAEALVRWRHPDLGYLMPDTFIEAIEQAGSIAHLTRWVLKKAIEHCSMWRNSGIKIGIAVNISVDDLVDEYLPYYLLELTSKHSLRPSDVTLEVTESAIMHDVQMSLSVVSCMRELGFRVAIDDFGTGQAALSQLKRLPVDELKIDKSFVLNLDNRRDEAIVRAAIELAHQFDLDAVAEGVEVGESLERVRQLGCEYAQGFYFAKPLPSDEFLRWAQRWSKTGGSDIVSLVKAASQS